MQCTACAAVPSSPVRCGEKGEGGSTGFGESGDGVQFCVGKEWEEGKENPEEEEQGELVVLGASIRVVFTWMGQWGTL